MPLAPASRHPLLRIQRTLAKRLSGEILGSLEAPSPELRAYQREYFRSLRRARGRRELTESRFIARLARADIVVQGEYHTLAACQAAATRIIDELRRRRALVLCLEAVPRDRQRSLDAYLAAEHDEAAFLKAARYESTWGFAWKGYAPIFRMARREEIQVYGINAPSEGAEESLQARDEQAARVIARASIAHPGALVYVIAGDFRVCRPHLPRAIAAELRGNRVARRVAVVHQNVDDLYWQLAEKRREGRDSAYELGRDEFCVLSSTPIVKYQSYLHWELGLEELPENSRTGGVAGAVRSLVLAIARFLRVDPGSLRDFKVYTTRDLDFLSDLQRSGLYAEGEIREVRRQILNDESYFLSRGNIIYLSSLSMDHAAEEAAHYVNNKLSGYVPHPRPARMDFYTRTVKEALGFLGSRIINPRRPFHDEADFREILARFRRWGARAEPRPLFELARFVTRHLDAERDVVLGESSRARLRSVYSQPLDLHLGIAHSLGYILGHKLHQGLVTGRIDRAFVRELFRMALSGLHEAEDVYLDLVRKL